MAFAAGTNPTCTSMGSTERHVAGSFGVTDGTRCGSNWIVAKRRTINALAAFLEVGADCVYSGTRTAQVAVAFGIDAHIVMLRADMTAEVNGIEIARNPDVCRLLANGNCCRGAGNGLLHVAYLQ